MASHAESIGFSGSVVEMKMTALLSKTTAKDCATFDHRIPART